MNPILAICPNPAIDRTAIVRGYRLGAIHRPERMISLPGGKGLNAARAIHRLGGKTLACVLLAGNSGRWIAEASKEEGIPLQAAWTAGETRQCYNVYDPDHRRMTEVYEKSIPIQPADWQAFEELVQSQLPGAGGMMFSGSLPLGAPSDGYARLIEAARPYGIPTLLDTHGECLPPALAAHPQVVKINAEEAAELLNEPLRRIESGHRQAGLAAGRIRSRFGLDTVIISLGKHGAVASRADGAWAVAPPQIDTGSATGSGDCMLGGLALALCSAAPLADALRLGVAAGAANALQPGAGIFDIREVQALQARIEITPLVN